MIEFLGGECCVCGCRAQRSLVISQPPGEQMSPHQLYSLVINDPDLAHSALRVRCATSCRQLRMFELFEFERRYQLPTVAPSSSSPDDQPAVSEVQPSSSTFGPGADRGTWGRSRGAGVAFG